MSIKEFMNSKKDALDALDEQIAVEDKKAKRIDDEMQGLYEKRDQLQHKMVKGYKKEDEIKEEIANIKRKYETGTISSAQEKDMISTLKKLEASLPAAAQLTEIMPQINKLKEAKNVHIKQIQAFKKEKKVHFDEKKEKYDAHKEMFQEKEEKNKEINEIDAEIKDQKAKIDGIFTEKKELKEEYYKKALEFYLEDREIRQQEFLAKRKGELVERKERKQKLL